MSRQPAICERTALVTGACSGTPSTESIIAASTRRRQAQRRDVDMFYRQRICCVYVTEFERGGALRARRHSCEVRAARTKYGYELYVRCAAASCVMRVGSAARYMPRGSGVSQSACDICNCFIV